MKVIFDLCISRLWSHANPVEAEVGRRRQQGFDGHATEIAAAPFIGQIDGVMPAVEVEHLLQRVGDTRPTTANSYDSVVSLRVIQFHVAAPLWKERYVPVGRYESYSVARCTKQYSQRKWQ